MLRRTKRVLILIMVCVAVAVSGCNKKSDSGSDKQHEQKASLSSPTETVNTLQSAMKNGDWGSAYDCMTEEGQRTLALAAMFAMDPLTKAGGDWKSKAQGIAEKHSVGEDAMNKRKHSTDIDEDFNIVAGMISGRRGFCVEAFSLIKQYNPNFLAGAAWDGTLSDVSVNGDTATGLLTQGASPVRQYEVSFKKVNDSWLIVGRPRPKESATPVPPTPAPQPSPSTGAKSTTNDVLPGTENLLKPGESYGKLRLGMTTDEMVSVLGKPHDVFAGKIWRYPDRGFDVGCGKDGRVISFTAGDFRKNHPYITAFKGKTVAGIGMGSSEDDVVKAYGKPDVVTSPVPERRHLQYSQLHTMFTLVDGLVTEIKTSIKS